MKIDARIKPIVKTACVYVPSPRHAFAGHPEAPERFDHFQPILDSKIPGEWEWLEPQPAAEAEILRVHTPEVLEVLRNAEQHAPVIIDSSPTFVSAGSSAAAMLAAGGALAATRAVLDGRADCGLALVRPPGHHAETHRSMGFCLVNNLAVGVRHALDFTAGKALIVDFDAHHGNGTEDIFRDEKRAAYVSTHQYGIYPGTGGLASQPQARGRIANIPLPVYAGDRAMLDILAQVVHPLAQQFKPDMLFVSAGFDAHWKDPLTALGFSTNGYYEICKALMNLAGEYCGGKIVFVLEGGYDPGSLAENVLAMMAAIAGAPLPVDSAGPCPYPEENIQPILDRVREIHGF
jgi:acetoin utilization deacetylase AcuC-like enzyme